MLRAGIVGLPNVGKSTLFNALTRTRKAESANYPFCTIDPNVGVVTVPDARLKPLAAIEKSAEIIPAAVEFVDIAGLVAGASQGEGMGNQFLFSPHTNGIEVFQSQPDEVKAGMAGSTLGFLLVKLHEIPNAG